MAKKEKPIEEISYAQLQTYSIQHWQKILSNQANIDYFKPMNYRENSKIYMCDIPKQIPFLLDSHYSVVDFNRKNQKKFWGYIKKSNANELDKKDVILTISYIFKNDNLKNNFKNLYSLYLYSSGEILKKEEFKTVVLNGISHKMTFFRQWADDLETIFFEIKNDHFKNDLMNAILKEVNRSCLFLQAVKDILVKSKIKAEKENLEKIKTKNNRFKKYKKLWQKIL